MELLQLKNDYIRHLAESSGMTRGDAITLFGIDKQIQKAIEDKAISSFIEYVRDTKRFTA